MDSMFITSPSKFISGTLSALSAMMQLALPHINVLSKCDLLPDKKSTLNRFFNPPMGQLLHDLNKVIKKKNKKKIDHHGIRILR
mmetsp:Transcript_10796/g.17281  ORF Transcript_10796/g.17281 Transcript_10796/m.17281 type:complete len:84 (+) Transcript_10796:857-1108(+)